MQWVRVDDNPPINLKDLILDLVAEQNQCNLSKS
jgi:hypothetical protein